MQTEITFKGIDFEVDFAYQEYEAPDLLNGHPGCPEQVREVYSFTHKESDFSFLHEVFTEEIDKLILELI